jgi:hypothetical protein
LHQSIVPTERNFGYLELAGRFHAAAMRGYDTAHNLVQEWNDRQGSTLEVISQTWGSSSLIEISETPVLALNSKRRDDMI